MPILYALGGILLNLVGSILGRVLIGLGIGFAAYQGINVGTDFLVLQIKNNISGMPAEIVSLLSWLWVDKAISMLFSAYAVALSFKLGEGAVSGVVKKMVRK